MSLEQKQKKKLRKFKASCSLVCVDTQNSVMGYLNIFKYLLSEEWKHPEEGSGYFHRHGERRAQKRSHRGAAALLGPSGTSAWACPLLHGAVAQRAGKRGVLWASHGNASISSGVQTKFIHGDNRYPVKVVSVNRTLVYHTKNVQWASTVSSEESLTWTKVN